MSNLKFYEVEVQIEQLTGKVVGPHKRGERNKEIELPITPEVRVLLKDWLEELGVERSETNKSDVGLIRCFAAGRDWVRTKLVSKIETKPNRPMIELGGFGQPQTQNLLDTNDLGEIKPKSFLDPTPKDDQIPNIFPKSDNMDDLVVQTRVENARKELSNQFSEATRRLSSQIAEAVKSETRTQISALGLGNSLTEQIEKLAQSVALRAIKENLPRTIELRRPNGEIKLLKAEPRHEKFDQILRYLSRGRHVYAVGPAGTGKSKLGEQLAEALGLDFYPLSPALTRFEASGYQTATGEYIATQLRKAIEFGGFALVDEGDAWAAAAMLFLNAPLANGYCSFPDKVVKVHSNFRCMIAANTFGRGADRQYVGRNPLDAASRNRFKFVEINYDRKLEVQLFGNGPWVQYCWKVREAVEKFKIPHVISMRNIELCVEDAECGDPVEEILDANLWQGLEPDTINKIKSIAGNIVVPKRDKVRDSYDEFISEFKNRNFTNAATIWAKEVDILLPEALEWIGNIKVNDPPTFEQWNKMRNLILAGKDEFDPDLSEVA